MIKKSRVKSTSSIKKYFNQLVGLTILLLSIPVLVFLTNQRQDLRQYGAFSNQVSISNGKLYINDQIFEVKGVNYNPIPIGSDQIDPAAPFSDVPKIAALGANTIATYNSSKFEWDIWNNAGNGDQFYTNLAQEAEIRNIKIIIGYFSNQSIDWTDANRVALVTTQYQNLVTQARDRSSTLMYLIGNELFEKLSDDTQRLAYAKWVGEMVEWTHIHDPKHPVTYADNDQKVALSWLKNYAPNLDIYSYNNYVWSNENDLKQALQSIVVLWPGKPILLHEWGVDSFDTVSYSENTSLQASRIEQLVPVVNQVYSDASIPLLGHVFFEFTDEWAKLGTPSIQTPDNGWAWGCETSFDRKCNEEYWGLATSAQGGAAYTRTLKPAYYALQKFWISSPTPTPTPTTAVSLTPTPGTNFPTVTLTNPLNNSFVKGGNIATKATATDTVGITKVQFYINDVLKGTDTTTAYSYTWDTSALTNGSKHRLFARAFNTSGNTTDSLIHTVTVDKVKPNVNITAPLAASFVNDGSIVTIAANASDSLSGVAKVVFAVNGTTKCTDSTASYSCSWTVPTGAGIYYTLKATATDKAGNTNAHTVKVTSQ